jgi:hypothetical protein
MQANRIMIIGNNVTTVQRVSSYCLKKSPYIFPYYGVPTEQEINLFAPNILILCLPLPGDFYSQIDQPYIFWSEAVSFEGQSCVNNPTDLYQLLYDLKIEHSV